MTTFTFLEWVIIGLAAFRIQRLITRDEWPPSEWLRNRIKTRFGEDSSWYDYITCPYCCGTHVTILVFLEHHFLAVVPFPVYACIAAAAVVGLLGSHDD